MKVLLLLFISLINLNANAQFPGYRIPSDNEVITNYGKSSSDAIDSKFSLLSWNIYKAARKGFLSDLEKLTASMDIVLLQEFYTVDALVYHSEQQEVFEYAFAASFENTRKNKSTGVLSGSKAIPLSTEFVRTVNREPVLSTPKVSLITTWPIKDCNTELMVVNTHAINFVVNGKFHWELDRIVEKIQSHPGPLIWAGDFNTWNGGRIAKLQKVAEQLKLSFAKLQNAEFVKKFRGYPLDHILYRGLTLLDGLIHKDIKTSDHQPLSATFEHHCQLL